MTCDTMYKFYAQKEQTRK